MDPLSVLRQYNINNFEIIERDNNIIMGRFSFPRTVKTNYLIQGSGKSGRAKDYYSLECLLYYLKNHELFHPEYIKQAAVDNIPAVRRPDRKQLWQYLSGEIGTCTSIDRTKPLKKLDQTNVIGSSSSKENSEALKNNIKLEKNNEIGTDSSIENSEALKNNIKLEKNNEVGTYSSIENSEPLENNIKVEKKNEIGSYSSLENSVQVEKIIKLEKNYESGICPPTDNSVPLKEPIKKPEKVKHIHDGDEDEPDAKKQARESSS